VFFRHIFQLSRIFFEKSTTLRVQLKVSATYNFVEVVLRHVRSSRSQPLSRRPFHHGAAFYHSEVLSTTRSSPAWGHQLQNWISNNRSTKISADTHATPSSLTFIVFHWKIVGKTYKIYVKNISKTEITSIIYWDSGEVCWWESGQRAITLSRWRWEQSVFKSYAGNFFSPGSRDSLRLKD